MTNSNLLEELNDKFVKIAEHAEFLGISSDQLATLKSLYAIRSTPSTTLKSTGVIGRIYSVCNCIKQLIFLVVCFILVLTVFILILQWPTTRLDTMFSLFGTVGIDFESQQCLAVLDSPFINLVRPPVDCSICRNLKEIDKVARISQDLFEEKYAYSGRPVVITDAMSNWTAVKFFSFEFFTSIYSKDSPVLTMSDAGNCQFFPYKTGFHNLSEVFSMDRERSAMMLGSEPWYIGWANCDSSAANVLRTYYTRPYFLPDAAESSRTDWIFMGSPGYGAHMHIDNVWNPSWQAQVTGSKLWTLEPPPECYLECEKSIQVLVKSGEIIVLDTNQWFHSTLIVGDKMSITIGSEYD